MTWLLSLLSKFAWWLYPKLIASVVDALVSALDLVEKAEATNDLPTAKRMRVMNALVQKFGIIPEAVIRFLVEFAVLLFRLGVTQRHLHEMEVLVTGFELTELGAPEKRQAVLDGFSRIFPDLPERMGRLLLEITVAKLKSGNLVMSAGDTKFTFDRNGVLICNRDGERIVTEKGEILQWNGADQTWEAIEPTPKPEA